ncbi:MAG: response regulator [Holophaga sp.]|nr:response regulator [Holophaga sp.]
MKGNVLYIEDNEHNLYLVSFILETAGYRVVQATSGEEGIARASSLTPDLILLDIQLPGMDGYEIARRLRSNPGLQRVPIVALTSYAMVGDREKALEAGCAGYLEKPINPDTFLTQVEAHLVREAGK